MPTYEYRCRSGHEFELFQRMSDPPATECPQCGGAASKQISGGAALLFKGEGFYITDYRSDEYRKAAKSESEAASKGANGASGKNGSSKVKQSVDSQKSPKAPSAPTTNSEAKRRKTPRSRRGFRPREQDKSGDA